MTHQCLQRRDPHVLIRLMGAEGMHEGMDANLFKDADLLHIFGNEILDGRDAEGRAVFGEKEYLIVQDKLRIPVAQIIAQHLDDLIDQRNVPVLLPLPLPHGQEFLL